MSSSEQHRKIRACYHSGERTRQTHSCSGELKFLTLDANALENVRHGDIEKSPSMSQFGKVVTLLIKTMTHTGECNPNDWIISC